MDLLKTNWDWIALNPWAAASLAVLFVVIGWVSSRFFYVERLSLLEARLTQAKEVRTAASPPAASSPANFDYPKSGRHGRNLLATDVVSVQQGETLSLRALVPEGSELLVRLTGPLPVYLDDTGAAWSYKMSPVNWTGNTYSHEPKELPTQTFFAEGGIADLALTLHRAGEVVFEGFEGKSRVASWAKTIQVLTAN